MIEIKVICDGCCKTEIGGEARPMMSRLDIIFLHSNKLIKLHYCYKCLKTLSEIKNEDFIQLFRCLLQEEEKSV